MYGSQNSAHYFPVHKKYRNCISKRDVSLYAALRLLFVLPLTFFYYFVLIIDCKL